MNAYRFDVTFGSAGSYRATCGSVSAASLQRLARMMVEDDAADAPVEGGRVGRLDWSARSLHRLAASAVSARELIDKPWQLHPALLRAAVAVNAEMAQRKSAA